MAGSSGWVGRDTNTGIVLGDRIWSRISNVLYTRSEPADPEKEQQPYKVQIISDI